MFDKLIQMYLLLFFSILVSFAQEATPPMPAGEYVPQPPMVRNVDVRAVLVKCFPSGFYSPTLGELNNEWSSYGIKSIFVDYSTLVDVPNFTYQDLVDSGADVIILSDPAGGLKQYSSSEIAALTQYANEGHNIIATYVTYNWNGVDNRGIAPLFGMKADINYSMDPITNHFEMINVTSPMFSNIPGPSWTSSGYPYSQCPSDDREWNPVDLNGAVVQAESDTFLAVITVFDTPDFSSIYITNMPEYYGNTLDKQLLYNAITYSKAASVPTLDGRQLILFASFLSVIGLILISVRKRAKSF